MQPDKKHLPCWCLPCAKEGLDPFFMARSARDLCDKHREQKPRVRIVDGEVVYV